MLKRSVVFLSVIALILSAFCSCKSNMQTSTAPPQHNPALDGLTGKFKTSSFKEKLNPELETICFIGNSLINQGNLPEIFEYLVDLNNIGVEVTVKADGGYTLERHLTELKSGDYADLLENTEIVVIQGGGNFESDTETIVKGIMEQFKPDTKFYFLLTQYDLPYTEGAKAERPSKRERELSGIKDLTYIPQGYVYEALIENSYPALQLQASATDYHPNRFYGYIGALTAYATIFDAPIEGFAYDFLDKRTMDKFIYSSTETDKDKIVSDVQRIITEVLAQG